METETETKMILFVTFPSWMWPWTRRAVILGLKTAAPSTGSSRWPPATAGKPAVFSHTDVCLHHSGSKIPKYRPAKECPSSCRRIEGFLSDPGVSIVGTTLIHNGKEFSDFCLGLRCDNAGERFGHWFEACGDCTDTGNLNVESFHSFSCLIQMKKSYHNQHPDVIR